MQLISVYATMVEQLLLSIVDYYTTLTNLFLLELINKNIRNNLANIAVQS